jgi:hypothetical protein
VTRVGERVRRAAPQQHDLLEALGRLDRRLKRAVAAAEVAYGSGAGADRFRGLYVDQDEVARLLGRDPGGSPFHGPAAADDLAATGAEAAELPWLRDTFGLDPFDTELILVALAPEIDLRYERLYAFLQDDVTRRKPTVELALNLLCPSAEAKLARRAHLAADAPLIR